MFIYVPLCLTHGPERLAPGRLALSSTEYQATGTQPAVPTIEPSGPIKVAVGRANGPGGIHLIGSSSNTRRGRPVEGVAPGVSLKRLDGRAMRLDGHTARLDSRLARLDGHALS